MPLSSTMPSTSVAISPLPLSRRVGVGIFRPLASPAGSVRLVSSPCLQTKVLGSGSFSSPVASYGSKTSKTAPGALMSFRMFSPGSDAQPMRSFRLSNTPTSVANPSVLWPPTPSPMATPYGFQLPASFHMPFLARKEEMPDANIPQTQMPLVQYQTQQPPQQMLQHPQMPQHFLQGLPPGAQLMIVQAVPMPQAPQKAFPDAGRQLLNEAMDQHTLDQTIDVDGQTIPLPSVGSALHGTGRCSPCAWYWKARGCQNDFDCTYCHICPDGELKNRKKAKVQAIRMGALEPAHRVSYANAPVAHVRGNLKLNALV